MEVSNPRDDRAERNLGGASVPLSMVIPYNVDVYVFDSYNVDVYVFDVVIVPGCL